MPGLLRREPRGEVAGVFGGFDHLSGEWARVMPFRAMSFPRWWEAGDLIRVEEFREDGTLVIRAGLPGIDPGKDVELTVSDGVLHIGPNGARRKSGRRRAPCVRRCATGRFPGRCRCWRA